MMGRCVEVCIVTADIVRRYAHGSLPSSLCGEVDDLLLQDERARDLVRALAPRAGRSKPPQPAANKIGESRDACAALVDIYQTLRNEAAPPTVRQFADLQSSTFQSLLADMRQTFSAAPAAVSGVQTVGLENAAQPSIWALLMRAGAAETRLSEALCAAYRSPLLRPFWKAQIAAWISRVEAAHCEIIWLDLVFTAASRP